MDVVDEEGFDELLENVRDRIDEIESLHRTRELTVRSSYSVGLRETHLISQSQFKDVDKGDMIRLAVDKGGADLIATIRGTGGNDDEDDDDD